MIDRTRSAGSLAEILVENSLDGLLVIDSDHRYTLWNPAMERFAGKRADEVLGKRVFDVFPFLREHGLDVALERAFAGESVSADAVPHVLPDGSRRYYDRLYLPLRGPDGAILGVLGIVRDATARRNAQDALRASEEHLRVAVETSGIGLWSWNIRTDEVAWEAPLCAIFGFPAGGGPVGRAGFLALVHPDDRANVADVIARGVEAGRWEDEYRIFRSDGALRRVMANGTVLGDLVLGAVIDVTERRQRDEQLRQAQKLEAVGQLTAGIAHNFNNMLMGMLSNLELAAQRAPVELRPFLHDAEESAHRAAHLVRQLMTYAGRNRPTARSVESVGALVERMIAFCRTTFDQRIAFDTHCDASARARVDPVQIEQALLNLLINARDALADAGGDAPRVIVGVDIVPAGSRELDGRLGDYVRVRVGDNGVGMGAATASRIFEPFFTTKPVGKGTGLGLATTRAIVIEHGGFVTCDSAPQKGATFFLYLPREAAAAVEPRGVIEKLSVRGTETILVVDDEAPIRHVVSLMLTGAGFTAKVAGSGKEALELLAAGLASTVSLVLLDVSMPGMSGPELRIRIRELAPQARVIYFTGHAFDAADAEDSVLEKPTTEQRLLGAVRDALDRAAPVRV
jgi:PAS domain S-box-containing protein